MSARQDRLALASRCAAAAEDLLAAAAQLRVPTTIACGASDPDHGAERKIQEARAATGHPVDDAACGGQLMVWMSAYRCGECGRFFHRDCLYQHFSTHGALTNEPTTSRP